MTQTLFTIGCVLGYYLIGALVARALASRIYRCRLTEARRCFSGSTGQHQRHRALSETRQMLACTIVAWPLALFAAGVFAVINFTAAPVAARQERAVKLRADAAYWTGVAAEEIDGERKAMAEELARSLSEQAKEVDL